MGNQQNKAYANSHFNKDDWVKLPQESDPELQVEHGQYSTFQHRITQQQIDKYDLAFTSQQQANIYYQCFLQRLREDYIVNTIEFKPHYVKEFCSTTFLAEVYVQHIPVRLSDITDIPFPQNIYILRCALLGFSQLFQSIGYFEVRDDHICIDRYGIVRVWMNSDLSKNYPDEDRKIQVLSESESTMVNRIVEIIQTNTDKSEVPATIQQYFMGQNKRFPLFKDALEMIDDYVEEYKVSVPDYCESILQIFEENQNSHKSDESLQLVKERQQTQIIPYPSELESNHPPPPPLFQPQQFQKPQYQPQKQSFVVQYHPILPNNINKPQITINRPVSHPQRPLSHKPVVYFNYQKREDVRWDNERKVERKELPEEKKKIVQNVLTSLNIHLPEQVKSKDSSHWSYNITGDSTEELDPEIASDLLRYL